MEKETNSAKEARMFFEGTYVGDMSPKDRRAWNRLMVKVQQGENAATKEPNHKLTFDQIPRLSKKESFAVGVANRKRKKSL